MEERTVQAETQQLPAMDFITYLRNLVETGRLYLAGTRNPDTDEIVIELGVVKSIIDTIEMLKGKTQGNLTAPEANFLANTLYELRMGYMRAINSQQGTAGEPEREAADTPEPEDSGSPEAPSASESQG